MAKLIRGLRDYGKKKLAVVMLIAAAAVLMLGLIINGITSRRMVPLEMNEATAYSPTEANRLLNESGITSELNGGVLMVPGEHEHRAREILKVSRRKDESVLPELLEYASGEHMWHTEAQNERRWLAAKMAALSRLISKFPQIESAEVLLEPGRAPKIGRKEICPSAVVNVCPSDEGPLRPDKVAAIRDLIAGSVAGLEPHDIRVIDSNGRSYPGVSAHAACIDETTEYARRDAEQYFENKIRAALQYIHGVTVSATVEAARDDNAGGTDYSPTSVTVSVPRDYFQRAMSNEAGEAPGEGTVELNEVISAESERIKQLVAATAGIGTQDVHVSKHYTRQTGMASVRKETEHRTGVVEATFNWWYLFMLPAGAGLVFVIAALARRMKNNRSADENGITTQHYGRVRLITHQDGEIRFEDIIYLPAERLKPVLQSMAAEQLALALRTAEEHVIRRIYDALPSRDARRLKKRIKRLGPVRLREIETAQQHVARRLVAWESRGEYVNNGSVDVAMKESKVGQNTAAEKQKV